MPQLDDLPLEVLLNITSFLDTPDYGSLRRTCSRMEKSLFDAFAKEFFSIKQFMLTSFSLSVLRDISNHPTLATYMRKVIIGLETVGAPDHELDPSSDIHDIYRDYMHMTSTGALAGILGPALLKLPNCTALEVRDFASRTKRRDDGVWRSYGVKSAQALGARVKINRDASSSRTASLVFNQIIMTIAQTGKHIESLGHIVQNDCHALYDPAFYVPGWLKERLPLALEGVQSFAVAVPTSSHRSTMHYDELIDLLRMMPGLSSLRINGTHAWKSFGIDSIQDHDITFALARPYDFPLGTIRRLELGKIYTTTGGLVKLLSRFTTLLESFGLYKVQLTEASRQPWSPVFDALSLLNSLRYVSLKELGTGPSTRSIGFPVAFKTSVESDDKPERLQSQVTCDSRVQDMKEGLSDICQRLVVKNEDWLLKNRPHDPHHDFTDVDDDYDPDDLETEENSDEHDEWDEYSDENLNFHDIREIFDF